MAYVYEKIPYSRTYRLVHPLGEYINTIGGTFTAFSNKQGVSNPVWQKQIAAKTNATTPYVLQKRVYSPGNGYAVATWSVYGPPTPYSWRKNVCYAQGSILAPYLSGVPSRDPAIVEQCEVAARSDFLGKIRDMRSPFKGPVFLKELRETMRMIKNPMDSLYKGIRDYVSTNRRRRRQIHRNPTILSDSYLEYTYGWQPLLSDVKSGLETYNRLIGRAQVHPVRARHEMSGPPALSTGMAYAGTWIQLSWTRKRVFEVTCVVGGALKDQLTTGPSASRALDLCAFRMDEFIPTVWECIPYSFLVDYFTNVGSVVNGWFTQTSDLAWVFQGTSEDRVALVAPGTFYGNPPTGSYRWLGTVGGFSEARYSEFSYRRTVPVFGLSNNLAFTTSTLSSRQWVNTILLGLNKLRVI
jgi:hypothetical protein